MGRLVVSRRLPWLATAAASMVLLCGCAMPREDLDLLARGPSQQFDSAAIKTFANEQAKVLVQISYNAGFEGAKPQNPDQWRTFVVAGFDFADSQCEAYMGALRRLEIARSRTIQQATMVGSATAGILEIVGAASSAIAITAVAFGLATATIDNVTGGLLYELKPSAVRDLVERTRFAYEENLKPDNWQDRPSSFRTIRGYVALCLPAVIEANATSAIRAARPQANRTGGELRGGVPRIGMEAPQATPGAAPALGTRDPVTPTPQAPPAELAGNRVGAGELNVTRAMAIRIQAGLCLPPDKLTGDLTTDTRTALEQFRSFTRKGNTGGMTPQEVVFLSGSRACDPKFFYQSAFERFAFPTAEDIVKYQEDVKKRLGARTPANFTASGSFDAPTREAIKLLQRDGNVAATGVLTDGPI